MQIYKIVLTGGPCSGKTKVTNALRKKLSDGGYNVIVVPETAAELIGSGVLPKDNYLHTLMFQDIILKTQKLKEDNALKYAKFSSKTDDVIIIYDRAIMDGMAYMHYESDFSDLLKKYSLNETIVSDKYDMIIDLVSLSSLRKDLYVNTEIRKEDDKLASILDKKTLYSWLLSDNLRVIKPMDKIEEKVQYVYDLITSYIDKKGISIENEAKIDLKNTNLSCYNDTNSKKLNISEYVLQIPSKEIYDYRVYERSYDNKTSYILKTLTKKDNEKTRLISQTPIDKDLLLEFLRNKYIKDIKEYSQIKFVDSDFNVFKIDYNKEDAYLKTYSEDYKIPSNIKIYK